MFGIEVLNSCRAPAAQQSIKRRVALAHRDGMFFANMRQQLPKPPNPALVKAMRCRNPNRTASLQPERLERNRIVRPTRKNKLQQIATLGAAKISGRAIRSRAAINAAQACGRIGSGSGHGQFL